MTGFQVAASWVPKGILSLDGTTLVGVVVNAAYSELVESVFDITDVEVAGAEYERLTATARVEQIGDTWKLFLDGVSTTDLSDVIDRQGVWWATAGADDSHRYLIGYAADPGGAVNPYAPTWPDGAYDLPIESIDTLLDFLSPTTPVTWGPSGDLTAYKAAGRVWLDGSTEVTTSDVGTLPVGLRPSSTSPVTTIITNDLTGTPELAPAALIIDADDGTVSLFASVTPVGTVGVSVTGLSFLAAP